MNEKDRNEMDQLQNLSEQNRQSIERMHTEIQRLKVRLALAEQDLDRDRDTDDSKAA